MRFFCLIIFLMLCSHLYTQELQFKSIHQQESEYYQKLRNEGILELSIPQKATLDTLVNPGCQLEKIVFGYHPYWMNNTFENYQWHLLSDLCYFSYEVNAGTGAPNTTHGWLTAAVIDSAQAHGVKTHLCATLFTGHSQFFSSAQAQQNLIDSLISLVQVRNADGINLDFESVSGSYGYAYMAFIIDLSMQYKAIDPDGLVSVALHAVDWSLVYNIDQIKDYVDIFFIMGYDYYWSGSAEAGPIAPLYSMTGIYNYTLSWTISYYQSENMPMDKMVLGLPYYGRQWPTQDSIAPSNTTGSGAAVTYSTVKDNAGGSYNVDNKKWEYHSFSSYYTFYGESSWYQCFICETRDFDKRYNIVNMRNMAGIGIWALGYDDGYTDLWEMIADKFSDCAIKPCTDTLYDSGGPYWDYFGNENYCLTVRSCDSSHIVIDFQDFNLENGWDSLWIYNGPDTTYGLVGAFSDTIIPSIIYCSDSVVTLRFFSNVSTNRGGWIAYWMNGSEVDAFWLGNTSDWSNTINWSNGQVPDSSSIIIIPESPMGGFYPSVFTLGTAHCGKVIVDTAANVSIPNGVNLSIGR